MDLKTYCSTVSIELTGWKAKLYDVVRKLDKVPTGDKEKVVPLVNHLHIVMEELGDRIDRLEHECPTEWQPEQTAIETKFGELRSKLDDVWKNISPGDIGG